jgi:hypothetical protein
MNDQLDHQAALAPALDKSTDNVFKFLNLPPEIRQLIYKILMPAKVNLRITNKPK